MQTIICMKWGTRYGAEYVNRLYGMIKRNTKRPTRLICFTDDITNIDPEVITHPLPEINVPEHVTILSGWRKLAVWQAPLVDLEGDVLFLDLDLVVTGNLDSFFDFEPGRYAVIHNWPQPKDIIGNTSAFRFPVGKYTYIFDRFNDDPEAILKKYRIEQQYISYEIEDQVFWPKEWCQSFKHNLIPPWPLNFFQTPKLPADTRIVAFTGKPDPDEAAKGIWPEEKLRKKLYKHIKPTPWIDEHWR